MFKLIRFLGLIISYPSDLIPNDINTEKTNSSEI